MPRIPLYIDDEEETIELEDNVQNNAIMNQKPIIPSNSNPIQINFLQKDVKTMNFSKDLEAEKRREGDQDEEFVIEKVLGNYFIIKISRTV